MPVRISLSFNLSPLFVNRNIFVQVLNTVEDHWIANYSSEISKDNADAERKSEEEAVFNLKNPDGQGLWENFGGKTLG